MKLIGKVTLAPSPAEGIRQPRTIRSKHDSASAAMGIETKKSERAKKRKRMEGLEQAACHTKCREFEAFTRHTCATPDVLVVMVVVHTAPQ